MTAPPWSSVAPPQPLTAPTSGHAPDASAGSAVPTDDASSQTGASAEPPTVLTDLEDLPHPPPIPAPQAGQGWAEHGPGHGDGQNGSAPGWPAYPIGEEPDSGRRGRTALVAVVVGVLLVVLTVVVVALVFGR
jgi:hypothetical protein